MPTLVRLVHVGWVLMCAAHRLEIKGEFDIDKLVSGEGQRGIGWVGDGAVAKVVGQRREYPIAFIVVRFRVGPCGA